MLLGEDRYCLSILEVKEYNTLVKFQIDDVLKVQIANALRAIAFWVPIAFLYYQSLGYTDSQIFALLSTLQLAIFLDIKYSKY